MLNEKQRSLVVLLFICSAFLSSLLTSQYGEVDEFWVVYNLPAYLLVLLAPSWVVVIAITMAMLFLKYTTILFTNPEVVNSSTEITQLVIGSVINISLFLTVSYFIISLEKRYAKHKKEEKEKIARYKDKYEELNKITENKEDTQ